MDSIALKEIFALVGANVTALGVIVGFAIALFRPHFNRAVLRALRDERGSWQNLHREVFAEDYVRQSEARIASEQLSRLVHDVSAEMRAMSRTLEQISDTMGELAGEVRRNGEAVARLQGQQE